MQTKRHRSWGLALFGLIFLSVGMGFLVAIVLPALYDGYRMQSWPGTQGYLISASLDSHHSDNSTTYTAKALYQYQVAGHSYENDRVAIHAGGDNIGDFQETTGRMLQSHFSSRQSVMVYYNPNDPADSVLIREQRWEMIGFELIFFVAFGGFGATALYLGLRGEKVNTGTGVEGKLWLEKPEWADNRIRSNAKSSVYAMWGFAFFWNLISMPVAFNIDTIYREEGMLAGIVLVFPLIGMALLGYAIKSTLAWRRFGITPLSMDPFPGIIGGDVGGEILVNMPYDPAMHCEVTLSCIHSYISGSGKNRSRHESVKWQDSGYARIIRGSLNRIHLQFKFTVPEDLPQSEKYSDSYNLWRLNINSELPGSDLSRSFEIPVFKVPDQKSSITVDSPSFRSTGTARISAVSLLPVVKSSGTTLELYYPMLRRPLTHLMGLVFGGFFAGIGVFLWTEAAKEGAMLYFMSSIFSLIGGGIVLAMIYALFNTLRVRFDGRNIHIVRRFLGLSVKKTTLAYNTIFDIIEQKSGTSTQNGNIHQIQYDVIAQTAKEKTVLAEHLDSHSKAKLVAEHFLQLVGKKQTTPQSTDGKKLPIYNIGNPVTDQ